MNTAIASFPTADPLAASFATSYAGVVAFIAVAHEGSFARAGDRLGIGRSAVSRSVQRLETQLDARLFHRTTRSTSLTREGELFFASCQPGVARIAEALDAMRELRLGPPRGRLRVASPVGFGRKVVAPLLRGFRERYPEVELDLVLDDRPVDFTADGIDIAFRNGRLDDSQVVARELAPMQMRLCASPGHVRRHGLPRSIDELARHRCIPFRLASGRVLEWEFQCDGQARRWTPAGTQTFNDAELVLQAVLAGEGWAQVADYQACGLLRSGELVSCLDDQAPTGRAHWLCWLSRRQLPARMRVFIDHMGAQVRALDLDCTPRPATSGQPGLVEAEGGIR